ncbi:MAG TPA: hemerythrin domain-containing protein [Kofleriaceae bacterium]|nr:hemerythrin domain-containing protein [Kofleriaceae bacterium]
MHAQIIPTQSLATHSVEDVLGAHHREIEAECFEIMSAGFADEPRDLTMRWAKVERELLEHMAAEERLIFPAYQHADPENAQDLRDEHAVLREHALEIGIAIQLHTIRCEQLQQFVDELRAHAVHEEASVYRWAQTHLDRSRRHTLLSLVR